MMNKLPVCESCLCDIINHKNEGVYKESLCEHCERSRIESFDRTPSDPDYKLYAIVTEDAQEVARKALGRDLSSDELEFIQCKFDLSWKEQLDLFIEYRFGE